MSSLVNQLNELKVFFFSLVGFCRETVREIVKDVPFYLPFIFGLKQIMK